jgi:hypothetical protein
LLAVIYAVSGLRIGTRFVGEEMIAMIRIPRVRLVLVIAALLILLGVPVVGARTLSSPSLHSADDGWLGAALRWAGDLVGFNSSVHHHGHTGSQVPPNQKDETSQYTPQGGPCIDPMGHTRPCF